MLRDPKRQGLRTFISTAHFVSKIDDIDAAKVKILSQFLRGARALTDAGALDLTTVRAALELCTANQTLRQVASLFGVSARTVERWMDQLNLPKPENDRRPGKARVWRPDRLIAWIDARIDLEKRCVNLKQIERLTGCKPRDWLARVKAGTAPKAHTHRIGGVGRPEELWLASDVRAWIESANAGYAYHNGRRRRRRIAKGNPQ